MIERGPRQDCPAPAELLLEKRKVGAKALAEYAMSELDHRSYANDYPPVERFLTYPGYPREFLRGSSLCHRMILSLL